MEPIKGTGEYRFRGNTYQVFHYKNQEDENSKTTPLLGDEEVERRNRELYEQIGQPRLQVLDDYRKITKKRDSPLSLTPIFSGWTQYLSRLLLVSPHHS